MAGAMTLSQEEQEKPRIKTGPTRHAKIMRGIVTPIFGLLAITCIVLGALNATVWKPDSRIAATTSVKGTQYVVTDPNVLQLVDDHVVASAKSRDAKTEVCIALGSTRDVSGWIAGSKYTRITGLSDWTTLSARRSAAQGDPDASANQTAFKDSDMWRSVKCGTGSVNMRVQESSSKDAGNSVALIDFGDGKAGTISLDWNRRSVPDFAMPFYLVGGLLVILAVLSASVFAMPPHKRRHRRAFASVEGAGTMEGDDTEVAEWVRNAEASAAFGGGAAPKRRRRHASHAAGASSEPGEAAQPKIVDPANRNLVADQQNAVGGSAAVAAPEDDVEATSVISQDELMAYFARLAREESSEAQQAAQPAASVENESAVEPESSVPQSDQPDEAQADPQMADVQAENPQEETADDSSDATESDESAEGEATSESAETEASDEASEPTEANESAESSEVSGTDESETSETDAESAAESSKAKSDSQPETSEDSHAKEPAVGSVWTPQESEGIDIMQAIKGLQGIKGLHVFGEPQKQDGDDEGAQ